MLILTRKRDQVIRIGESIVVRVIRTGRNTVKIGIEAPSGVRILRAELCGRPRPEAAQTEPPASSITHS